MMEFSKEQLEAVIEELQHRSKRVKSFSDQADTLKDRFVFIGYSEAYERLCDELKREGGLQEWER